MQIYPVTRRLSALAMLVGASACSVAQHPETESATPVAASPVFDPVDVDLEFRDRLEALQYPASGPEVFFGAEAPAGRFLETALIIPKIGATRLCTGVLIEPDIVLTARHCHSRLVAKKDSLVLFGDNNEVSTSNNQLNARFAGEVAETRLFPRERGPADIMLLRLKQPAPPEIPVARLAHESDIAAAQLARIVGFGVTERGTRGRKVFSDVGVVTKDCSGQGEFRGAATPREDLYGCVRGEELVAGLVKDIPPQCSVAKQIGECLAIFSQRDEATRQAACTIEAIREREFADQDFQICADTCNGDSGGPLFVAPAVSAASWRAYNAPRNWVGEFADDGTRIAPPRYALAAITSRAVDTRDYVRAHVTPVEGRKCGNGGIYTLLTEDRLAWITEAISDLRE